MQINYKITSLGDSALLVDFGNTISEELNSHVIHLFNILSENPVDGMIEAVPAISSLAVYYDLLQIRNSTVPGKSVFDILKKQVEERIQISDHLIVDQWPIIQIPVCYDPVFGFDLDEIETYTRLPKEKIIELHISLPYRVYMIGFLPGFPYSGEVDPQIRVPRKSSPVTVPAGSIGIAGSLTGIYPFLSPGGWHIIGRTPIHMFMKDSIPPVLLKAGDQIQFYKITLDEFENYQTGNPR